MRGVLRLKESFRNSAAARSRLGSTAGASLLALAIGLLCSPAAPAEESAIGFVTEVSGAWYLGDARIARGQSLPAGAVIRARIPDDPIPAGTWRLRIALLNGLHLGGDCLPAAGGCTAPIYLPVQSAPPSSLGARIIEAASRLLVRAPDRFVTTKARGESSTASLRDRIIVSDRRRVAVGALFQDAGAGNVHLTLVRLPSTGPNSQASHSDVTTVRRTSDAGATVLLRDGLYEATLSEDSTQTQSSTLDSAWFAVFDKARSGDALRAFQDAERYVSSTSMGRNSEGRQFLRAVLRSLASGA